MSEVEIKPGQVWEFGAVQRTLPTSSRTNSEPTGDPLLVAAAAVVHARKRLKQLNSETYEQEKRLHAAKESLKAGMKEHSRETDDVFVIGDYSIQWGVMGWEVREVTRL